MTANDINKDKFIKNLMKKGGTEKAPDDFTQRVMQQLTPEAEITKDRLFSPLQWALIGFAVVAAIGSLFLLDVSFLNNIFSFNISEINFNLKGQGFIETMSSFFESIRMSSVTFMAIAAVLILLGLERLLRHGFTRTNMNML